jgi:hypothetical protein
VLDDVEDALRPGLDAVRDLPASGAAHERERRRVERFGWLLQLHVKRNPSARKRSHSSTTRWRFTVKRSS